MFKNQLNVRKMSQSRISVLAPRDVIDQESLFYAEQKGQGSTSRASFKSKKRQEKLLKYSMTDYDNRSWKGDASKKSMTGSIISRDGTGKYSGLGGLPGLNIPNTVNIPGNSPLLLDLPIDNSFEKQEVNDRNSKSFDWDNTVGRKQEGAQEEEKKSDMHFQSDKTDSVSDVSEGPAINKK